IRSPRQRELVVKAQWRVPWILAADHGECACREQAAHIAIALLADNAKLVLAPARVLLRREPNPGREWHRQRSRLALLPTPARRQGSRPAVCSSRLIDARR